MLACLLNYLHLQNLLLSSNFMQREKPPAMTFTCSIFLYWPLINLKEHLRTERRHSPQVSLGASLSMILCSYFTAVPTGNAHPDVLHAVAGHDAHHQAFPSG